MGASPADAEATRCTECGQSLTPLPGWQVQRECNACGKTIHVAEPGEGGRGLKVEAGDRVHIPAGTLRLSLDPRKSSATFTRRGAAWFARAVFTQGTANTVEGLDAQLEQYDAHATSILKASPLLHGLDFDDATDGDKIIELAMAQDDTREYWALWVVLLVEEVKDAIASNDARAAAWRMGQLGVCRAMLLYTDNLEAMVWRGHTLGNLRRTLAVWTTNRGNADEAFWQQSLAQHAIVLSQTFSFPVMLLGSKVYVGGRGIDGSGGKEVDFLLANPLTDNVALVEIKTPLTRLLNRRPYRHDVYSPSTDLSGAVAQIANYRDTLLKSYALLAAESGERFHAFDPHCLVIAGSTAELTNRAQRKSFEAFRRGLKDVQIITFDELFGKVAMLVNLLEGAERRREDKPHPSGENT